MEDSKILKQIKDEYSLGNDYMNPWRIRYRDRLLKWNPQVKKDWKININMIWNAIDTLIASFWSNGVKVKFISKQWWIWAEEAENLNSVAEFDKKETIQQQLEYQIEQDSLFFWVWICNRIWFDHTRIMNKYRAINPLSWIPDPLPTQTWQFDAQNYRFMWFMLRTTAYDMKKKYDNTILDQYFAKQTESESQLTRDTYTKKNWYWAITCDTLENNFSSDIYNHYTIVDWYKWLFITDSAFGFIFDRIRLEPVTKEEKLDPLLVPRPIMLNYTDPQRDNPLGWSICDKLEDKQNAKSILFNLNLIKSKKEALWWDFLVNSRLIKNKNILKEKTTDTRYLFVDEEAIGNNPIQNAMFELPQSQIKWDTFAMMNALDSEANKDVKIDALQSGLVPDKSMTKAEAQQIQGNANNMISLKNWIKSRYYQEFYYQRWRWYLENLKDWQKKFALLASDFEWKGIQLTKDEFVLRQSPYIMIWSNDDINATNEKQRQYLNLMFPQIMADPETPKVSKDILKRLVHRINWLQSNVINTIVPYSAHERKSKDYVDMVNMDYMPKTIFDNVNLDYFVLWLYMQKAKDWEIKDKILNVLNKMLIEQWLGWQQMQVQNNAMANSAANIQMSQNVNQQEDVVSRPWAWEQTI